MRFKLAKNAPHRSFTFLEVSFSSFSTFLMDSEYGPSPCKSSSKPTPSIHQTCFDTNMIQGTDNCGFNLFKPMINVGNASTSNFCPLQTHNWHNSGLGTALLLVARIQKTYSYTKILNHPSKCSKQRVYSSLGMKHHVTKDVPPLYYMNQPKLYHSVQKEPNIPRNTEIL